MISYPKQTAISFSGRRHTLRKLWVVPPIFLLAACAAALIAATGGSLSSSVPAVAAFSFPNQGISTFTLLLPRSLGPVAMALHPDGQTLYISNQFSQSITVLNTGDFDTIATLEFETSIPQSLTFTPDGSQLFVATGGGLLAIDPATASLREVILVEGSSTVMAVTSDSAKLYVANAKPDFFPDVGPNVSIIDTATRTVSKRLDIEHDPLGLVLSPDGRWIIVANTGQLEDDPVSATPAAPGSSVTLIATETDEIVATIAVGTGPTLLAVNPDSTKVYVVSRLDGTVSVIDLASRTVIATLPLGALPNGIALAGSRETVFVGAQDGTITLIDSESDRITNTLSVGTAVGNLVLDRDQDRLFALLPDSERVTAFGLDQLDRLNDIPVGDEPVALSLNDARQQGYALARASSDLSIFDSDALTLDLVTALEPNSYALALSPDGGALRWSPPPVSANTAMRWIFWTGPSPCIATWAIANGWRKRCIGKG